MSTRSPLDCLRKMNKLLSSIFVLFVALVTAPSAIAQEVKGDPKAGEHKIAMCIGCHGIRGYQSSFPEVYKVPMIAGQGAKYIASALGAYQRGERKHPTMRGIAETLTEQDIADLAVYYESLGKKQADAVPGKAEPSGKAAALITKGACVSCHGESFSKPIDPSYPKIAITRGRARVHVVSGSRPSPFIYECLHPPVPGARQVAPAAPRPTSRPSGAAERSGRELTPVETVLFEELRSVRRHLAAGKPAYTVLSDQTLHDIARRRPASLAALANIKGMGPVKLERYGDALLAVVETAGANDQ